MSQKKQQNLTNISGKLQKQKPAQKQNIFKQKIVENLNKQSNISHHKPKQQFKQNNQSQNQQMKQITQRSTFQSHISNTTSFKNRNIFNLQSQRSQNLNKQSYNQFLSQEQIQNRLMMIGYFKQALKQVQSKKTNIVAQKYINKAQDNIKSNITNGSMGIEKHKEQIKNLLNQCKMTDQQLRMLQKKAYSELRNQKYKRIDPFQILKTQKLRQRTNNQNIIIQNDQKSLSQAKMNIVDEFVANSILTKQQHKKLIKKFIQSRKNNQQKHKQAISKQLEKQKSLSLEKITSQQKRIEQEKQKRRLSIQKNLIKKKKEHQDFLMHEKVSNQRYKLMKKQKFLYQNMEDKYHSEIIVPSLQQRKLKLKQIREFHKKFDIEQLKRHQNDYLERKSQQSNKANSRQKNHTFHYNPPQRAKRIERLLEEEKLQAKIKFQQKKRISQQNKLRQINFISDIKIKFRPKIDLKKRQQIELRLKSQESDFARNKLSQNDIKLLGLKHFQDAKKNAKKLQKTKTEGNDHINKQEQKPEFSNSKSNVIIKNNIHIKTQSSKKTDASFSSKKSGNNEKKRRKIDVDECRRKQLRKLINSTQIERDQKLVRLKIQNERITQIYKRKQKFFSQHEDDQKTRDQAINLLLNSIQTKMGIIDVCSRQV